MGGITTGTGIFSGMDTRSLIDQLIAVESRPKILAQRRVAQLQQLQAAYLDLNSKMSALKTAAGAFRVNNIFKTNKATSSKPDVLTATASTGATPGQYTFIVDRMVTTQKMLSRGFASGTAGLNAGSFTFEPESARLTRETSLSDLNGGEGVERGKIVISVAGGNTATIDLTKAATVSDVLEAINSETSINVTASVEDGRFVVTSNAGGNLTITSAYGYDTAASLGIEALTPTSSTVTGGNVYRMTEFTSLSALNDGNGIFRHAGVGARHDFEINVGGTVVKINIGDIFDSAGKVTESAPTSLGGVIERMNSQLAAALGTADTKVAIAADGVSLEVVDAQGRTIEISNTSSSPGSTTASDLGLATSGPATGTVQGKRILAGMNTTLARTLNGGSGVTAGTVSITGRDGVAYNVDIEANSTVADILASFSADTGGKITAKLNSNGTGLIIEDKTGGAGNLIISGAAAESLGIDTDPAGVASAMHGGENLQHQYITKQTLLSSLRTGQGVGTGSIRITDSTGFATEITIADSLKTVNDLVSHINSAGAGSRVKARINSQGDGIELYEELTGAGTQKIKVEDVSGAVAFNLNLKGEAAGTGAENVINGSYERTITFDATDGLDKIASKITAANVGISASIINDGSGSTPFRLSMTSKNTGSAGRVLIDSGSFNLGLETLDRGQDARVFFGSSDPAKGVLLTSSRNTLDNVVTGVTIDLNNVSTDPITLTVTRDTAAVETAVNTFVTAFNAIVDRIAQQTKYDKDNNTRGPLLGDSTTLTLQSALYGMIGDSAQGLSGQFQKLTDVGISVGEGGKLKLDRDELRAAMEQDFENVAELFSARELKPKKPQQVGNIPGVTSLDPNGPDEFTKLGAMGLLEELSNQYINTVNGTLTRRNQAVTDLIQLQNKRITDIDSRLANRRLVLERQFLAMEQAIGKLQTQQSALGSLSFVG